MTRPFAVPAWLRGLAAAGLGLLGWVAWGLGRLVSQRGMRLCFLALAAWLAFGGWLRPPVSDDIGTFRLPLLANHSYDPTPAAQLYEPRVFVPLSPGMVLLATLVVGVLIAVRKPDRFGAAAGLLVCTVLGCLASVLLNHPELMTLLDDQMEQRKQVVAVLAGTTEPPLRITDAPRVEDSPEPALQPGALLRGVVYLHTHRLLLLMLAALACLLTTRGTLGRRVGRLAVWSLVGLVFAGIVALPRLSAEWRWALATQADWRGDEKAAQRHAAAALARFPELARLERTWALLGRVDYRQGRVSPAARYFHAYQLTQNKEFRPAIEELEDLARVGEPAPAAGRWLASWKARLAFAEFHDGRYQAAEDDWQQAIERDGAPGFRPLLVATMRARAYRADPSAIAHIVDPLLGQLQSDRTLRAAVLAMLGDSFFKAGQFVAARAWYEKSMAVFNLPKHVNFRGQRGLLGM